MKYLLRVLGVLVAWPLLIILTCLFWTICNIFIFLYHLNFKHFTTLTKDDFLFNMSSGTELDLENKKGKWYPKSIAYRNFYATPSDMLKGKITHINEDT